MRILTLSLLLTAFQLTAEAQLYNQGATIKVQTGALIFVQGDVQNNSGGSINNDGKIEVQGSFTNAATYTSNTGEDSLILSGGGNVTLNGGASSYNYLTISKTANSNIVRLTGSTTVNTKLDYLSGNFTTDPIANPTFVLSAPTSAAFNFTAGREITGRVRRTGWTNSTVSVFNQPNMRVSTAGGTAPTDFTVLMIPETEGGNPSQTEREVKRTFGFAQTGGTGFTADIRFPYLGTELNTNTETNLVPWQLISSEWNGRLTPVSRDAVNDYIISTGIAAADLSNEWKLADPRYTMNFTAYLRAAWNSGTGTMNTTINSILPLTQPYNDASFGSYAGTESVAAGFFASHTNIVDWILVDIRKPASGLPGDANAASSIGRRAGFLLNNGTIVDLDGVTPLGVDITKQGGSFSVIRHRNHLGIMSNLIPSNAAGTFTNNYSLVANVHDNNSFTSDPQQALPSSALFGMWAGNANKDGNINASDIGLIKANANVALTGYVFGDANMDGTVNAGDVGLAKVSANGSAQANTYRSARPGMNKDPKTHVPQ